MAPGVLGPRHGRRARWLPIFGSLGPLREECLGALALHTSTRDEPVHLSGSRPETHQHWSPADANCCQSLLLDPDGIVRIDLHKWLFLLVSGRGESPRVFPYHGCALPTEPGGRHLYLPCSQARM